MCDGVEKKIKDGKIKGTVTQEKWVKDITITDTRENLVKLLSTTDHDELFEPFMLLRKVEAKPPTFPVPAPAQKPRPAKEQEQSR